MKEGEEEEKCITDYPKPIAYDKAKVIIKQMDRCICHVKCNNNKGTAFFTKIPFPSKHNLMPVLVSNNHIIGEEFLNKPGERLTIYIKEENRSRLLDLNNRIKYTNKDYDITFVEIKPDIDRIIHFLELDDNILNDGSNKGYINETIYNIHYPLDNLSLSLGIIQDIEMKQKGNEVMQYNFKHLCSTLVGSSGSPILLSKNNKVVGVHKLTNKNVNYNIGVFLSDAIKDFINKKYYEIKIKHFNEKFNLGIKPNNLKEINIPMCNISNEGLELLSKIEIKDLKKLVLEKNNITNINALEKSNFVNLEKLYLNNNQISDITVLQKVKFEKLENLYLSENEISDINVLEKVNFPLLKKLKLDKNKITDINVLSKVKFEKLELLYLGNNDITDISVFEKVNFKGLKLLDLKQNHIANINSFDSNIFQNLEELNLGHNNINSSLHSTTISLLKSSVSNLVLD